MEARSPEACYCLRKLLRGLPSAVYRAVIGTNLQRSGCVHCGIGPHSTNECPILGSTAEEKADRLYRRWAALIGDELLIFSRSLSTEAYAEGAGLRLSNRNDLPKRRPRRMATTQPSGSASVIPVKKPPVVTDPILPDPAAHATPTVSSQTPKPSPRMSHPLSQPIVPVSILRRDQAPNPSTNIQPKLMAAPVAIRAPKSKAKEQVAGSQSEAVTQNHATPRDNRNNGYLAAASSEMVVSQDLQELPPDSEWEQCNTHLDDAALLLSISRISQDVEMIKARLVGHRRSRELTPSSAQHDRAKFVCVEHSPSPQQLDFRTEATAASSSSSVQTEYESWDLERYVQARQLCARQRFWQCASEAAKGRMVQALYGQPAGTPATIQARENGWIPV